MKNQKEVFGLSGQEEILANQEAEQAMLDHELEKAQEVEETLPGDDEDPYADYVREEMEAMKRNNE